MSKGKVKFFLDRKGYGIIVSDTGKDVFVHYTQIQSSGFKTLMEGQSVEFELYETDKGLQAKEVRGV